MSLFNWAQLLLLGAIWGGSFFFARIAVAEIHPLTLVLFRVAIAAAALHIYLAARGPSFRLALPHGFELLRAGDPQQRHPLLADLRRPDRDGRGPRLGAQRHHAVLDDPASPTRSPATRSSRWNKVPGILLGIAGTAVMVGPGLFAGLGGPVWAKFALIGASLSYAFAADLRRRFKATAAGLVADRPAHRLDRHHGAGRAVLVRAPSAFSPLACRSGRRCLRWRWSPPPSPTSSISA